jgi:hypothetical protein
MKVDDLNDGLIRERARACRQDIDESLSKISPADTEYLVEKAWLALASERHKPNMGYLTFIGGALSGAVALWMFSLAPMPQIENPKQSVETSWTLEFASYIENQGLEDGDYGDYDADVVPGFGTVDFDTIEYDDAEENEWDDYYDTEEDNFSA